MTDRSKRPKNWHQTNLICNHYLNIVAHCHSNSLLRHVVTVFVDWFKNLHDIFEQGSETIAVIYMFVCKSPINLLIDGYISGLLLVYAAAVM